MREPQQLHQERIHIHDHPGLGVKDQNAVPSRLKEPTIAHFRSAQRRRGLGLAPVELEALLPPSHGHNGRSANEQKAGPHDHDPQPFA